jgi:hypothetical protein
MLQAGITSVRRAKTFDRNNKVIRLPGVINRYVTKVIRFDAFEYLTTLFLY